MGGGTAFAMINDLFYLEAGAYASFSKDFQKGIGVFSPDENQLDGPAPYWRAVLQYDWQGNYFSLGHYGLIADVFPGRDRSYGTDHYTDVAVDATYQFMGNTQHIFETKATYIYEDQNLKASRLAGNVDSNGHTYLTTFKFNTAYTFDQTYGITFAYNRITGSKDTALYADYDLNKPNSEFYTAELVYVPFGKSNFYSHLLNLRVSLQYIGYSKFNGQSSHSSENNTFMVNGWLAF